MESKFTQVWDSIRSLQMTCQSCDCTAIVMRAEFSVVNGDRERKIIYIF